MNKNNLSEEWKPIKNFKGLYEISNYGNVKALAKEWICGNPSMTRKKAEHLFANVYDTNGYKQVKLRKNGLSKNFPIHCLVWDHFGDKPRNGQRLQIDHKDNNKENNSIWNLQLLTNRKNTSKYQITKKNKTSKYVGVSWHKTNNKWVSKIYVNGYRLFLGYFSNEEEAHLAYQNKLLQIESTVEK
ncbi:MAG: NUMOD4 domain-containing protein [Candidatus Paceibacterota bacterium]|jgi:hypothetical protein